MVLVLQLGVHAASGQRPVGLGAEVRRDGQGAVTEDRTLDEVVIGEVPETEKTDRALMAMLYNTPPSPDRSCPFPIRRPLRDVPLAGGGRGT